MQQHQIGTVAHHMRMHLVALNSENLPQRGKGCLGRRFARRGPHQDEHPKTGQKAQKNEKLNH